MQTMKNACENCVRNRYVEFNENCTNMEPNGIENVIINRDKITENEKETRNKLDEKLMPKQRIAGTTKTDASAPLSQFLTRRGEGVA